MGTANSASPSGLTRLTGARPGSNAPIVSNPPPSGSSATTISPGLALSGVDPAASSTGAAPVAQPRTENSDTLITGGRALPAPWLSGAPSGDLGSADPRLAPNVVRDQQGNYWIDYTRPPWIIPDPPAGAPAGTPPQGAPPQGAPAQPGSPNSAPGAGGQPGADAVAAAVAIEARTVAVEILQQLSLPAGQVRMSPDTGLVGLPAWFWVDGYDGRPFGSTRTEVLPPLIV